MAIYNITTIIILDAGEELGTLLGDKEIKTDGVQIIPANSYRDGNTIPAVDVCNELDPDKTQTKEDTKVTKCEEPKIIPENSSTPGNVITALDTSNELNLDKVQTSEGETLKSNKIDVKLDQTSTPSSSDQQGLSVTLPKTDEWRLKGIITFNFHC